MKKFYLSIILIALHLNIIYPLDLNSFSPLTVKDFAQNTINPIGTIKICAIRVEFSEDEDPNTTGDGSFLFINSEIECPIVVDPPPHNKQYFLDHIRALSNYYYHVSRGKLYIDTLNSHVYPEGENEAYRLKHKMSYYHPFDKKDSIDIRLTELFIDAVKAADEDIDFSNYDLVVVFHAGVGQDFTITLDPTPYDIPSVYLRPEDFNSYINETYYSGIPVDNGTLLINKGIILPETENHILYPEAEEIFAGYSDLCEFQIGLNGIFALMFGYAIGLPALYDTESGVSGVGKFALMDQGSVNLNGLVPSIPSAWERIFLGWEKPAIATNNVSVILKRAESYSDTTVWLVPINEKEYFLIENRYSQIRPGVTLDSMMYRDYIKAGEKEYPSIFPYITGSIGAKFSKKSGVLTSVPRYDVGLPGSGLLIWHIDEGIIKENYKTLSINNNRDLRGIDLEEADGAQQIGFEDLLSFDVTLNNPDIPIGWYFDPWFAGNEGFFHLNPDYPRDSLKTIGFADFTNPSTKSNTYSYTGIRIDSIGNSGEVMTFRIMFDNKVSLININKKLLSEPAIIKIYGRSYVIALSDSIYLYNINGKRITSAPFTSLVSKSISEIKPIIVKDNLILIVVKSSNIWHLFKYQVNANETVMFTDHKVFTLTNTNISSNVTLIGNRLAFATEDSLIYFNINANNENKISTEEKLVKITGFSKNSYISIYGITVNGNIVKIDTIITQIWQLPEMTDSLDSISLLSGFINKNENIDLILSNRENLTLLLDVDSTNSKYSTINLNKEIDATALADVDGDSSIEIILLSNNNIYAYNEKLIVEGNFPIEPSSLYANYNFSPQILTADVDNDNIMDIIVKMQDVGIFRYSHSGNLINLHPIAIGSSLKVKDAIFNSNEKWFYLTVSSDSTKVNCIEIGKGKETGYEWRCSGSSFERNYHQKYVSTFHILSIKNLLDWDKVYNWPNPVKGNSTNIRFFVNSQPCKISVKVFDLAGNKIDELKCEIPLLNDYNELKWDTSRIQNGVYFAVVKATGAGREESKIIKILITK